MRDDKELVKKEVYADAMKKGIDLNGKFYAVSLPVNHIIISIFISDDFDFYLQGRYIEKMEKKYGFNLVMINAPHDDEMYASNEILYLDPDSKLMFELPFGIFLSNNHIIGKRELEKKEFNLIAKAFRKAERREQLPDKIISWIEGLPKLIQTILFLIAYPFIFTLYLALSIRAWYEYYFGEVV